MFIQTEETPNPATLKFLPGIVVLPSGTVDLRKGDDLSKAPLAMHLFEVDGVEAVFFGYDFITITKNPSMPWPHLKPAVLGAIMEHFMAGQPVVLENAQIEGDDEDEFFEEADTEIVNTIKELLETRVRPAVAQDGGDITFHGYKDGTVYLNMRGACAGCPSSSATLKHGIQNLLKHFIPQVQSVEPYGQQPTY
ncbi:MAG: NifU family protein [Hyphomicrobiales bacterium]